jgi:hypothetical protein
MYRMPFAPLLVASPARQSGIVQKDDWLAVAAVSSAQGSKRHVTLVAPSAVKKLRRVNL